VPSLGVVLVATPDDVSTATRRAAVGRNGARPRSEPALSEATLAGAGGRAAS
jgi:hypothetical protein